jgi:hypothetical protein
LSSLKTLYIRVEADFCVLEEAACGTIVLVLVISDCRPCFGTIVLGLRIWILGHRFEIGGTEPRLKPFRRIELRLNIRLSRKERTELIAHRDALACAMWLELASVPAHVHEMVDIHNTIQRVVGDILHACRTLPLHGWTDQWPPVPACLRSANCSRVSNRIL